MIGSQDSCPFPRIAGPAKDFVRGSINNRPFRPGGLEDSQSLERILPDGASNGDWVQEMLNGGPVQVIPPSFKQGVDFGELKVISLYMRINMKSFPGNHVCFILVINNLI